MALSKNPPRGTYDLYPRDFAVRKYIFDTWRRVCVSFGYQEYLWPIVESADIWKAKSGEDVGGSELTYITDRLGNVSDLALRPEMTPTVTRMVANIYQETPKPIRYFSIANFYRNERPQRGRNREFWQLNFDLFGSEALEADIEIVVLALELILAFNPPRDSFRLNINNRKIINYLLDTVLSLEEETRKQVVRSMDKWGKLSRDTFTESLSNAGLSSEQIGKLIKFMEISDISELVATFPEFESTEGYADTRKLLESLERLGYGSYARFSTSLIRGFDYYDGTIFEMFDLHPDNTRAMFWGGRYNGLASVFGAKSFPAVGSAPGDETFRLFLESWGLIEDIRKKTKQKTYYIPLLSGELFFDIQKIGKTLRSEGKNVETGIDVTNIRKSLEYANKREITHVVFYGGEEQTRGCYKIKNMNTGEEQERSL